MRFPDIPFMKSVFDLILREKNSLVAGIPIIIPYVLDNPNNLNFFNGIVKTNAQLNVKSLPPDAFDTGGHPDTVSNMIHVAMGDFTCI